MRGQQRRFRDDRDRLTRRHEPYRTNIDRHGRWTRARFVVAAVELAARWLGHGLDRRRVHRRGRQDLRQQSYAHGRAARVCFVDLWGGEPGRLRQHGASRRQDHRPLSVHHGTCGDVGADGSADRRPRRGSDNARAADHLRAERATECQRHAGRYLPDQSGGSDGARQDVADHRVCTLVGHRHQPRR